MSQQTVHGSDSFARRNAAVDKGVTAVPANDVPVTAAAPDHDDASLTAAVVHSGVITHNAATVDSAVTENSTEVTTDHDKADDESVAIVNKCNEPASTDDSRTENNTALNSIDSDALPTVEKNFCYSGSNKDVDTKYCFLTELSTSAIPMSTTVPSTQGATSSSPTPMSPTVPSTEEVTSSSRALLINGANAPVQVTVCLLPPR